MSSGTNQERIEQNNLKLAQLKIKVDDLPDIPVKLFTTIEEMQADPNPSEGDLAVVYRNEIQPVTEESEFDSCTFPNTVVLDEAFTDSIYGSFRSTGSGFFDGMVDMSSSSFRFNGYGESDEIRVQYESQDGITYTRTDGGEELQEFGVTIRWGDDGSPWNDVIGEFMEIGGKVFEGLFQYGLKRHNDKISFKPISRLTFDVNHVNDTYGATNVQYNDYITTEGYSISTITTILQDICNDDNLPADSFFTLFKTSNNQIIAFYNSYIRYVFDINKNFLGVTRSSSTTATIGKYTLDLEHSTYTKTTITTVPMVQHVYEQNAWQGIPLSDLGNTNTFGAAIYINGEGGYTSVDSIIVGDTTNVSYGYTTLSPAIPCEFYNNEYSLAPNQLNATSDVVYNSIFYGKNGVEVGTLGVPDNSFADVNAELVYEIEQQYNNMQPRVLTDQDKEIDKNIYFIPTKSNGTPLLDTSNVTNMSNMFDGCTSLATIPLLNTSNVTAMNSMLTNCSSLTTISLLDTSNVTNMSNMFSACVSLTTIPLIDTSNVTNMRYMFNACTSLITIPLIDTSSVTNMFRMFGSCASLTTIPSINTSNVTNMSSMFIRCTSLTTIPLLDTSSATDISYMFTICTSLTTVPLLNTSNVITMGYMFDNCSSLSNESLNNIMRMCINASKISSNKTLAYIGLTQAQAQTCTTLSNYQAFLNAGWTTGY